MLGANVADQYAKHLGALEKDAFESEVCARLAIALADFQRIPRKPNGDAGLDGLSHGQTRAYCCYGPEQHAFKKNVKGLTEDILKKFRSDLRKLFELEYGETNRRALVHKNNVEIPTILVPGRKLANIYLIVSVFETHRIIGPLNESLAAFKQASACTYVDACAEVTIWGPEDLSTRWALDEHALFRAQHHALLAEAKAAAANPGPPPTTLGAFDEKFDYLLTLAPQRKEAVERLRSYFRKEWATALELDRRLAETSVQLHELLEDARTQASVTADLRSSSSTSPFRLLDEMRTEMRATLGSVFGARLDPLAPTLTDGEIARLIGECPVDWRK